MRLSTRFGIGAAVAVLPLLGVIGFSVDRMHRQAGSNQRLAERSVTALQLGAGVLVRLERIDEYLRKYSISKDAGYARLVRDTIAATQVELDRFASARWTSAELAILARLQAAFAAFRVRTLDELAAAQPAAEGTARTTLAALVGTSAELQREMQNTAEAEAARTGELRAQTWQTAIGAALGAALLSALALVLTVRALRSRLDQLIEGTEAVSRGTFSFQLDSTRDDELDRAAAAFNQMVTALDEIERIKADFISSVSHELRTPIVAMQETTRLLLDEVVGPLSPRQRTMLELNAEAGDRLARMIAELLDLSRLKAGLRATARDGDLTALTRTAVSQLEALALERDITLQSDLASDALLARCDPDRYMQVVQNLVENAVKYTPAGGTVAVRLAARVAGELPAAARVGDQPRRCALLQVEDSGAGIPETDRQRVFEKFFRRDGLSSSGGAGLGLAICREIVEAHGGSVWVGESHVLGGALLNVALPLAGGEV